MESPSVSFCGQDGWMLAMVFSGVIDVDFGFVHKNAILRPVHVPVK